MKTPKIGRVIKCDCGKTFEVVASHAPPRLCPKCRDARRIESERRRLDRCFGGQNAGLVLQGAMSHSKVGFVLGISRTAVQRIERLAIIKLRQRYLEIKNGVMTESPVVVQWTRELNKMVARRDRLMKLGLDVFAVDLEIERCRQWVERIKDETPEARKGPEADGW